MLAITALLGKALICSKKWIHYRSLVDPHICSASIMCLPGGSLDKECGITLHSPSLISAAQNVPWCIHPFITDWFFILYFLNMTAGTVWREIYEYVIQEMMIVSVKEWWVESILEVSWLVSGSEEETFADAFQLSLISTEGVVSREWNLPHSLPMHQNKVCIHFLCSILDSQSVPSPSFQLSHSSTWLTSNDRVIAFTRLQQS